MLDPSKPMPSMNRSSPSSLTGMLKCCAWPGRSTKRRSTIRTPASRARDMTSATVVVGEATPLGIRSRVVIAIAVLRPSCASRTKHGAVVHLGRQRYQAIRVAVQYRRRLSSCAFCMTRYGEQQRDPQLRVREVPVGHAPPAAGPGRRPCCGGRRGGRRPQRGSARPGPPRACRAARAAASAARRGSAPAAPAPGGRRRAGCGRCRAAGRPARRVARTTRGGSASRSERFERRPGRRLRRRSGAGLRERPRHRDGPIEERREAVRRWRGRPGRRPGPRRRAAARGSRELPRSTSATWRHQQPQLARASPRGRRCRPGRRRRALAGRDQHDPRRSVGGQRVAAAGLLAGLADGLVACQLQREQRRHPLRGDPLELVRRLVAEQDQPSTGAGLAGRRRDVDPQRAGAGGAGEVAGHGRRGRRQVGRGMDGDRVAAAALDDDGAAEERADRRRLDVEPATQQREPGELGLEVGRPPIELGPAVDEEADDAAFERDRVGVAPGAARSARRSWPPRPGRRGRRSPVSPSTRSTAGTRARASATASSWICDGPGATTASAGAGMIARSPVSSASNAGTRGLRTRTQPTSRSARSGESSAVTGRAAEPSGRARGGDRAASSHGDGTPRAVRPGGTADGDEVVEQRAELALDVDVAIGPEDEAEAAVRGRAGPRPVGAGGRR